MRPHCYRIIMVSICLLTLFSSPSFSGTSGKIAGTVTDKTTGDPLPGVNIVVDGTTLGSITDVNGNYTILFVPPGFYDITVSMIGYKKVNLTNIRVLIDQTAREDVGMNMATLEGEAVTVVAQKNIIKKDVATSVAAVSAREVEELPVSSVSSVVGLQAGVQDGLQIRGGMADQALFLMDGTTLRDPRNNQPVASVALSAIKELSIERGGFNAEYGQVRSGIVNVVTKEGSKSGYFGNVELKYSPPHAKYFGISPFDKNSFWLKPYYDDAVCWTGTKNGAWDEYTQRQYPDFEGWNSISQKLLSDNDPNNNLTPMGAQRVFMWETRKQEPNNQPDYNIDAGFGGPIPVVGKSLGNLRFFTSYRRYREMLVVPLTRPDYVDYDWSVKVNSDITPDMKLTVSGLVGKQFTMQQTWSDAYIRYPNTVANVIWDSQGALFGTGSFSLADIGHKSLSAKLTHMLSQKTFYEVSLEHFRRNYFSRPTSARDLTKRYEIVPGYFVDEAPYGYNSANDFGIAGMLFGAFSSKRRDNTRVSATTLKADLTSQMDFNNLVKTGLEVVYNDLDFDYGVIANYSSTRYDQRIQLHVYPVRASYYLQDKLETKGFIMNAGLRLDYSNSNTEWWDVNPYDKYFFSSKYSESLNFPKNETKAQWQLSPRLGISHPITENSKLFFNYGHFKQMPSYETLFRINRSTDNKMSMYGDPNLILAKTVSYELGYDHTLFNDYLIQLAAFYHDITDQQSTTQYASVAGVAYTQTASNSYADIRGFELTLRKNRGQWWTFFGNYTYQVTTSGHFGRAEVYEDPSKQREYDEATVNLYQERPMPRPYARLNVSLYTPDDYGPAVLGFRPLGGYMANLLLNWQAGGWTTWNPKGITSIANNIQETDYFDSVLRLSKSLRLNKFRVEGFVDISNLFNYRRMSLANFGGKANDRELYNNSLHLPESNAYDNIPGDDRMGSYRNDDVDYQPMFPRGTIDYALDKGDAGVIYYDRSTKRYVEFVSETWQDVDKTRLNKILENKAYIDMPDQTSFTFFNPRQVFFGLRVSFDLN
jgi:outer membrane receptor protein involved in Fe transport